MMSTTSRGAMLSRRPTVRPLVITRSTFAGAGTKVGHWLGDNAATWQDYRISISGQLQFAFIYQVPMVGSDVCGYAENTTENLCARWATLGAFSPFYRNHAEDVSIPHEFYRWDSVAEAARNAIDIRYRLLDYLYTAFYIQSEDGTPLLNPLWAFYPNDKNTYAVDTQFFFGSSVLVSPVIDEDATSVSIYLPNDLYYDWYTLSSVQGTGAAITLNNIPFTSIPLHIRGGGILPLRSESANTTTALRQKPFTILVAPGSDGTACGTLYLDDGESLTQAATSEILFQYTSHTFTMNGTFGYDMGDVGISAVQVLGLQRSPGSVICDGEMMDTKDWSFNATNGVVGLSLNKPLTKEFSFTLK